MSTTNDKTTKTRHSTKINRNSKMPNKTTIKNDTTNTNKSHPQDLNILQININGLLSKTQELRHTTKNNNIDVITLPETKL